jgi:hypothetical protein
LVPKVTFKVSGSSDQKLVEDNGCIGHVRAVSCEGASETPNVYLEVDSGDYGSRGSFTDVLRRPFEAGPGLICAALFEDGNPTKVCSVEVL